MFSSSPLCDRSQDYGIDSCPKCEKFIYYSSQRESRTGHTIHLKCGVCKENFEMTVDDRLSLQPGHPVAVQPITFIEDIEPGDLICYLRVVTTRKHMHYAIVTDKDEYHTEVTVIEFVPHFPFRWGRVKERQRNMETDIISNCAWVFRYMPCDCLPTPQVLENAREFVQLRPSKWKHRYNRNNNTQHLVSWCKSKFKTDLEKFLPSSLRETLTSRIDLVRNCPAILHTNLLMSDSCWSQLPSLNECPSCKASFNRSSLINANEIVINLECGACSKKFVVRNMTSQKQRLMTKYGKYGCEIIESLDSITVSDILVFSRNIFYSHHSLITGKNENGVVVTEFSKEKLFHGTTEITIKERSTPFTLPELKYVKVKRYLPLDCLQRNDVLSKMEEFKQASPPYRLDMFNCQTLCTFVKTGLMTRKREYLQLDLDPILWSIFNIFRRNRPKPRYLKNKTAEDECIGSEATVTSNFLKLQAPADFAEIVIGGDDFITHDLTDSNIPDYFSVKD